MTTPLSTAAIEAGFAASPRFFPHSLDIANRRVLMLDLTVETFLGESFLDDRLFQSGPPGGWLPEEEFVRLAARLPAPARSVGYVFHVGHCGSTLLSRLLAAKGDAFPLREPVPLRVLADARVEADQPWDPLGEARYSRLLDAFTRSWARRPAGAHLSLVKATSLASGLAPDLMEVTPHARALALRIPLPVYLAALLSPGEPSADLMRGARVRLSRLSNLVGDPGLRLHALTPGELAAVSWLAEAATLSRLATTLPDRVIALDFEDFLAAPADTLSRVAGHFGLPWQQADAGAAIASPIMQRYSKSPDQAYTPGDRAAVQAESAARNAGEIDRGRALVDTLVGRFDALEGVADWTG